MIQIDKDAIPKCDELHEITLAEITAFCKLNKLKVPNIKVVDRLGNFGECSYLNNPKNPHIRVRRQCTPPVKTPGYGWSFPGYKADTTNAGVLAHEFGHAVHFMLMKQSDWRKFKEYTEGERPVSSYEPNLMERFAESMKLFITNPNLLKVGRPRRYAYLTKVLGLKPVHNTPWETVLSKANEKYIKAATSWIGKIK